jgi:hypothetical protein
VVHDPERANPASSAAIAVSAIRSNMRSLGTSVKVKLGIWSPKLGTAISSLSSGGSD